MLFCALLACVLQDADDTAAAVDIPEASAQTDKAAPTPAGADAASDEPQGTPAPSGSGAIGGLTPAGGLSQVWVSRLSYGGSAATCGLCWMCARSAPAAGAPAPFGRTAISPLTPAGCCLTCLHLSLLVWWTCGPITTPCWQRTSFQASAQRVLVQASAVAPSLASCAALAHCISCAARAQLVLPYTAVRCTGSCM